MWYTLGFVWYVLGDVRACDADAIYDLLSSANIKKADSLERSLKLPILRQHFNSNPTMDPSTKWGWNRVNISRTKSQDESQHESHDKMGLDLGLWDEVRPKHVLNHVN